MAGDKKSLTKVEMLSLELLIAVAQQNKRSPGHVMVNKEDRAVAHAEAMADWRMQRAGGFQLNDKIQKTGAQIKRISKQMGADPTLKDLMDLHAEALKKQK